jgi:hypothetical protein
MRDVETINLLADKLGGLTAMAAELSKDGVFTTPQAIYAWKVRGRVAPEHRQRFLSLYNRTMPKSRQLGMDFLATPATDATNGAGHGRKSGTKPKSKRARKAARRKAGRQ